MGNFTVKRIKPFISMLEHRQLAEFQHPAQ